MPQQPMHSSPDSPMQVVQRYFDALASRDYTAARTCLAGEGFCYRSPIGNFDDADEFVADLWRLGSIMEGITICAAWASGPDVCHVFEVKTRWSELVVTRIAQWSRVEDGHIREIEAFFDAQRYAELFEH